MHAVIATESAYNPAALSPKGARGLMQLMPATAKHYGVGDVWNPSENIRGGTAHLRDLLDRFGGDTRLALAAYNAGAESVQRYSGVPPYPETRQYVTRVLSKMGGQTAGTTRRPMESSSTPSRIQVRVAAGGAVAWVN